MNIRLSTYFANTLFALILLTVVALAQVPQPLPLPSSPATASAPAATPSGKRGAITGRVLGEDGQPLEGAVVLAAAMNGDRMANRTAVTDEEGNFKLKDLPAAAYIVQATAPGLVNTQGDMLEAMTTNKAQRYRIGESVTITMVKGGAITGKVFDGTGQPLVGAAVWLARIRDAEGRSVNEMMSGARPSMSDDRGVYRLYGLRAGSYVVYTSGVGAMFSPLSGASEVSTYHPNATRDTAQEISVSPGMEVQGIDIRHRGEPGHAVSGTLVGAIENSTPGTKISVVELFNAATGTRVGVSNMTMAGSNGFAMYGIPDGDYEITGTQRLVSVGQRVTSDSLTATPRRISVRGGDVTGIELKLIALGSVAGRVVLETSTISDPKTCQITRRGDVEEILLLPRREDKESRRSSLVMNTQDSTPNDKGEFIVRELEAGRYRLTPQLPSDHWYVKAMSLGGPVLAKTATTKTTAKVTTPNLAASGLTLKSGEKLSGLTVTIAEGAAGLSGRVDGKNLPSRLRVQLVPAETEAASDVLRYFEVVTRDGAFRFGNLAPGKYWLLARVVPDDESEEKPAKPVAWDATERAKLRRDAEAANNTVILTTCQRVKDFALKFGK